MVKDNSSGGKIQTANPFAVLGGKKVAKKANNELNQPAKKRADTPKEAKPEPKKESKPVNLTTAKPADPKKQAKEQKKEEKHEEKVEKAEKSKTDRHDRSGKGHQVRKEGKGVGGWEESTVAIEPTAEEGANWGAVADVKDSSPTYPKEGRTYPVIDDEEKQRLATEAAAEREMEEKQMTLDEYLAKQKKDAGVPSATFNIRTVSSDAFKNMKKATHQGVGSFKIAAAKKEDAKEKVEKAEKAEKEKKDKKLSLADTGFRVENPATAGRGRGGRGEGRGRGGRDGGRGGRGEGRGRGGRGYQNQSKPEVEAPAVDSEEAFPSLGGKA
eukprot:NODE_2062_length_1523_cov_129.301429_g1964_i0.p1 GENE.NODE_2062_length_1523_cov_129.301429_g1964_i0~~NODE_2062_length_1523_cov_129.301429_g1964_i0.p1  ORF type:complete len:327 (+),score=137.90 NODE_2062_length_1523_cov_129.301429_g1964_i0:52-1032(+)